MIDIQALFNEVKQKADTRNIVYDKNCTCVVNGRLKSVWGRNVSRQYSNGTWTNCVEL